MGRCCRSRCGVANDPLKSAFASVAHLVIAGPGFTDVKLSWFVAPTDELQFVARVVVKIH
jgi:hypothetical protein